MRVDSGVAAGSEVPALYDPLIAKLIVHGVDREHARNRMLRALDEFVIEGVKTLIGFHKALLTHPCFVEGETCHGLVESELMAARAAELENGRPTGAAEAALAGFSSASANAKRTDSTPAGTLMRPQWLPKLSRSCSARCRARPTWRRWRWAGLVQRPSPQSRRSRKRSRCRSG